MSLPCRSGNELEVKSEVRCIRKVRAASDFCVNTERFITHGTIFNDFLLTRFQIIKTPVFFDAFKKLTEPCWRP
jgi:hypothetical protein